MARNSKIRAKAIPVSKPNMMIYVTLAFLSIFLMISLAHSAAKIKLVTCRKLFGLRHESAYMYVTSSYSIDGKIGISGRKIARGDNGEIEAPEITIECKRKNLSLSDVTFSPGLQSEVNQALMSVVEDFAPIN